jgi:uncharacterized protein YegP (UPF0339 family)
VGTKGGKRLGRVEFFRDSNGDHHWRIKSPNGNTIATSGNEGYRNEKDALAAFKRVTEDARNWGRFTV